MDRKQDAAFFRDKRLFTAQALTLAVMVVLAGLSAAFSGCKSSGGEQRAFLEQIRPASSTARLVRNADYLKRTGRVELAIKDLEEAHLQKPENLEILDALIQCYEELGHFDRAQELYKEALNRTGRHPALENNRCYSLYLAGRLAKAEACFRELLAGHPENETARSNLGLVLCRQGRENEAMSLWRETLGENAARERLGQAMAALKREVPPTLAIRTPSSGSQQAASPTKPSAPVIAAAPKDSTPALKVQEKATQLTVPETAPAPPETAHQASAPSSTSPLLDAPKEPDKGSPEVATSPAIKQTAQKPAALPVKPRETHVALAPEPSAPAVASDPGPTAETVASLHQKPAHPATPHPVKPAKESKVTPAVVLTRGELVTTRLEIKNGNGVQGQARELRSRLSQEGFTVVGIGNHIDFGLEETIIAYRLEAAPLAKALAQKFLPGAKLEEGGKLSPQADVRVSLGRDRMAGLAIPSPPPEATAASAPAPPTPAVTPEPPTPEPKAATAKTPQQPASPPAHDPDFLSARELTQVRIEIKNGNGIQGQARKLRSRLSQEGFTVVGIGNHIDFGLEETVISYRPEAARMAEALAQKFFPRAKLEEGGRLSPEADVRVSLGRDLIPGHDQVAQAGP